MGLSQVKASSIRVICWFRAWQVENLFTQFALVHIWRGVHNDTLQLFHVKQVHVMIAWMVLTQV